VRGSHGCVGVEKMVLSPVGQRIVHLEATLNGPKRYRACDADDWNVLAVGAADTVDSAQSAHAVGYEQRAQAVQARIAVRRIGRVQLTAGTDSFQRASVPEQLQQRKVVIAGNTEQVPNTGFLQAAKQKVSDRLFHSEYLLSALGELHAIYPIVSAVLLSNFSCFKRT
jgi:hypothetical protein